MNLAFTREEFEARLAKVRAAMVERSLDLLILSDPCNFYYVAGYEAWSFYVQQYLLVRADDDRPVWLGREMDARGARLTTWLRDEDLHTYPDSYVQSDERHPGQFLANFLRERGWHKGRIGVESQSYYLTAKTQKVLEAELGDAAIVDASLLVNRVRAVKSPAEIEYMRQAARIVEGAMATAIQHTRPGVRQCDVAAEIYRALMRGTPDFGGQYASSPPFMPSGERVDTPHLSWTDQPYASEGQANFELVACRHRYHTQLSRTVSLGRPTDTQRRLEAAALEGIEAALTAARPGARACDVEAAWREAAARHGVRKSARVGYAVGIAYPPTVGEQTISLRPEDRTVLEPGMTFHLMPAVWQEGASIVITEPFVVTETGAETFCRFERKLFWTE
ncbi:Xaa-Pro peptidase family protein [Caulobacter segnis]|uniref:M24 family metallopeptidase n=1 Tax=Caulobacter segnis TaxID=88688 RepID=UPI00240F828F|nr:Xaa-Pro peptidase family protein [Caulobacter segnis]MDG2521215.1 Xaa-Pro peptidase family protein [Caulobacter segnis]